MKINQTPAQTCNNYQINSITVSDQTFDKIYKPFAGAKILTQNCNKTNQKPICNNPLCEKAGEQLQKANSNISLQFFKSSDYQNSVGFDLLGADGLVSNLQITTEKNTATNLTVYFAATQSCFTNSFISINCQDNSSLNLTIVCDLLDSQNFQNIETNIGKNANVKINFVDFCNHLSVVRQTANSNNHGATFSFNMLYLGTKDSTIDINIINNVFGKNSSSNLNVIGALFDSSQKSFKGTIDFKKGSSKSTGNESELCMLIGDKTKSKALPMLLCGEEDVQGSHSSATSKIDPKQLFYIMSRGYTKSQAIKLLLQSKFSQIILQTDQKTQKLINNKINKILGEYEKQF